MRLPFIAVDSTSQVSRSREVNRNSPRLVPTSTSTVPGEYAFRLFIVPPSSFCFGCHRIRSAASNGLQDVDSSSHLYRGFETLQITDIFTIQKDVYIGAEFARFITHVGPSARVVMIER